MKKKIFTFERIIIVILLLVSAGLYLLLKDANDDLDWVMACKMVVVDCDSNCSRMTSIGPMKCGPTCKTWNMTAETCTIDGGTYYRDDVYNKLFNK